MNPPPGRELTFTVHYRARSETRTIRLEDSVIAGWTARDRAAMQAHIAELAELGVTPPPRTPMFYRVACARLTSARLIEVCGEESSGEVEFVILNDGGELLIGVGSDHTDRKVECYDITTAKQMCDKPLAPALWSWQDISPHWDRLRLRATAGQDEALEPYQDGSVATLLAPLELIAAAHAAGAPFAPGSAMFGGTLPAIGGIRPARRFAFELLDPVLERRLGHAYEARVLPAVG